MTHKCGMILAVAFFWGISIAQADPILMIEGDQLTGASGVLVDGKLYDVAFVDGTCIDLFTGCDNSSEDFPFSTASALSTAMQTLLNSVLIGTFDEEPDKTSGCTALGECSIFTPLNLFGPLDPNSVNTRAAVNNASLNGDSTPTTGFSRSFDTTTEGSATYAVWQLHAIPEPNTILLLSTGLFGLAGYRWHQRRRE